jgi:hypothetical protein
MGDPQAILEADDYAAFVLRMELLRPQPISMGARWSRGASRIAIVQCLQVADSANSRSNFQQSSASGEISTQVQANVRYRAVRFRESPRSTLRSATTRDRARHPYARTSRRHWSSSCRYRSK